MPKKSIDGKFDFKPIGLAIKKERMARGISREALAEQCNISEGYIKEIENAGKHPGFQLFWRLVTKFNISVDEYFYSDRKPETDSERRKVINLIHEVENDDVYLLGTMARVLKNRKREDNEE